MKNWACSIVLVLIVFTPTFASSYFVSNTGHDLNPGTRILPFATLQYAADIVTPGDTVLVFPGNYIGFALNSGGSELFPLVFLATGQGVVIDSPCPTNDGINIENADYVIIDGFKVINQPRNGIRLALSDHCVVRNCICDNNLKRGIFTAFTDDILIENNICSNSIDEHGIYISNSSDRAVVRYNECFENNNIGIHLNGDLSQGGDGIISDVQIYGNYIHDNHMAAGINMDGVENAIIYNNLIVNNHFAQGIAMFQGDGSIVSNAAKIYNNTIIVPSDGRWGILMTNGANTNTEIFNNIIINQHTWRGSISCESTSGLSSNYNLLVNSLSNQGDGVAIGFADWQDLGFGLNSHITGSLENIFVNHSLANFKLLSNSVAVDAGNFALVSSIVTSDYSNLKRPCNSEIDLGAFEYCSNVYSMTYSVLAMSIIIGPETQNRTLEINGEFDNYAIKILDHTGNVVEELSNDTPPILIKLDTLDENILFLSITHSQIPELNVHNLIKN